MTVDELKEKYRSAPLIARFAIMTIVGLIVPAYIYSEESKVVESNIEAERQKLDAANATLNKQRQAKNKIPGKEQALDAADKKINDIRRTLPPSFAVHEVLRKVELLANDNEVVLLNFQPNPEVNKSMYIEMPFTLRVEGKFIDVTRYVDELLHFETLTKVSSVEYSPIDLGRDQRSGAGQDETPQGRISRRKTNAGVAVNIGFAVYKTVGL